MVTKSLIFLYIFFSSIVQIFAQKDRIRFDKLSTEDGLSQSSVSEIYQDKTGFLWFGTYDGLNRYDGYQFKVYRHSHQDSSSICQNSIRTICEDRFGALWVGTEEGLSKYNPETESFTNYFTNPSNPNSISSNRIRKIIEDKTGTLWISTEYGINKYDRQRNRFVRYNHNPDNPNSISHNFVRSIFEDSKGNLWIGTDHGLDKFNRESRIFFHYKNNPSDPNSLSENTITSIKEDSRGAMWIGTRRNGLNRMDNGSEKFKRFSHEVKNPFSIRDNTIRGILEDNLGDIWIATNGGLEKYDYGKNKFIHYHREFYDGSSISNNTILCIIKDRAGIIWIGTDFGGINKFDKRKNQFTHYSNNLNNPKSLNINSVNTFYEDPVEKGKRIWVGTWGGGFSIFDREKEEFTAYKNDPNNSNSLSNNVVRSITKDKFGIFWIGTDLGVNQFDPKSKKFIRYQSDQKNPTSLSHNLLKFIYEDRDGEIWIGTNGGGLEKFDRKKNCFIHFRNNPENPNSVNDNIIWCIYEDNLGYLWLGTDGGGLNRFDKKSGKFIHFMRVQNDDKTLSNNKVLCIHGDKNGLLWLGTAGGGLNKFDPSSGHVVVYNEKNGSASNTIHAITEDNQGFLWLSSTQGISKFDRKEEKFINFNKENGLQSSEFHVNSFYKSITGELFFGGINGFNVFRPENVKQNTYIPQTIITDFQLFNKPVEIGSGADNRRILEKSITQTKKIILSYYDDVFTIQFAALDFTAPEKNMYAYKMEGFENDWNYVGNRSFATYTNLPSGNYKFVVKGSNHNGVWNEKGISLEIMILPPFWETWWFRTLSLISLIGLLITGYKVRTSRIKARSRELEQYVSEKTQQLETAHRELESFSYSVSNDLRFPLHIIDEKGKVLLESYSNKVDDEGKRLLRVIIQNCQKMGNLINDLLEFSKIGRSEFKKELIEMETLVQSVADEILETSKRNNYSIKIEYLPNVSGDFAMLKQVWINLISNAVKFTSKKIDAKILIGSEKYDNQTVYFVKDNGAGFDQQYVHKLFGVFQRLHKEEDYEGTGVGLAIVQRIIQRHGGKIWAEGEVDIGAIFYFTLPQSE